MERIKKIILTILSEFEVTYEEWLILKDQIDIKYKSESLKIKITKD